MVKPITKDPYNPTLAYLVLYNCNVNKLAIRNRTNNIPKQMCAIILKFK